jgi:hypothetical protein
LLFAHGAHKADALAQNSADQSLISTIVADGHSSRIDTARQRGFRNDPPVPNRRQQVVPAHHPIAISDQKLQQVEDLGFDRAQLALMAQLAPIRVN